MWKRKVIRAASVGSRRIPSVLACTCSPSPAWCDGCNSPRNTSRRRYVRWRRAASPSEVCAGTRAAAVSLFSFLFFHFPSIFNKITNNRISSVGVLTSCQPGNATWNRTFRHRSGLFKRRRPGLRDAELLLKDKLTPSAVGPKKNPQKTEKPS